MLFKKNVEFGPFVVFLLWKATFICNAYHGTIEQKQYKSFSDNMCHKHKNITGKMNINSSLTFLKLAWVSNLN